MKFAEHLAAHITPEWRKQYIQYEEMKVISVNFYNYVRISPKSLYVVSYYYSIMSYHVVVDYSNI